MKRVLSAFLALVLLCSCSFACADIGKMEGNFTIRNGVTYGMSISEVKAIEENNGLPSPDDDHDGYRLNYTLDFFAGYPDVDLSYRFTNNKLIREIDFSFLWTQSELKALDAIFLDLYASLKSKYGNGWENYYSILEEKLYTPIQVASWLVEFDDCYVNIQLRIDQVTDLPVYNCELYYIFLSKETLAETRQEEEEEERQKEEQRQESEKNRNNDL